MQVFSPLVHDPELRLAGVECKLSFQIPTFQVIGRASTEIHESRDRVRAALESCGLEFPRKKVVVSLTPGELSKTGTGFDLAIAVAVLHSIGAYEGTEDLVCWGELGMDGSVSCPRGVESLFQWSGISSAVRYFLPAAAKSHCQPILSRKPELRGNVHFISHLRELWDPKSDLHESEPIPGPTAAALSPPLPPPPDLLVPVALSAVGRHHLLLLGSKGTGKSHALEWRAWLERLLKKPGQVSRIVRVGHHVRPASLIGIVSSGTTRPGLLQKSHDGLLIADELLEWSRDSLETLREPLQEGRLALTRAGREDLIPCRFLLAAAANPCPCGHPSDRCVCATAARRRYLSRLSGALLDRIGICASVQDASVRSIPANVERLIERVHETAHFFNSHGGPPGNWSPQELEARLSDNKRASKPATSLRGRHQRARVAFTLAGWNGRSCPTEEDFRHAEWFSPDGVYESLSRTSRTSLWDPIARSERAIS